MIAVVNYGVNNLASVTNALRACGVDPHVTDAPDEVLAAGGIVLPGIGAASTGMQELQRRRLVDALRRRTELDRPLLGICLGMQLLFEASEEGSASCLGIFPGRVVPLRGAVKVPHMGWNSVQPVPAPMWDGLPAEPYCYFVHSFICEPDNSQDVAAVTDYAGTFCSAVARGNVWGTQFHPERSGEVGLTILRNFVALSRAAG